MKKSFRTDILLQEMTGLGDQLFYKHAQDLNFIDRKSEKFSQETCESTVALYLKTNPTIESVVQLRKDWDELQAIYKDKKSECVVHRCGALVLPNHISKTKDVCSNCDPKYQPCLANPIFQSAFQKLAPMWVFLLFNKN